MFKELLEDFEKLSLELTGDQMEVYASNVLDDLEKIALAKWKRNFHTLSPENQELLTKSMGTGKKAPTKKVGAPAGGLIYRVGEWLKSISPNPRTKWRNIYGNLGKGRSAGGKGLTRGDIKVYNKIIDRASGIDPASTSRADRRRIHEANIARKTLDSNFKILDHEKELAGLNTGSYAMAKKFGVPIGHFDENYLMGKVRQYYNHVGLNAPIRSIPFFQVRLAPAIRESVKSLFTVGGGYSTLFHPTDKSARVINLGNKYPEQIRNAPYLVDSRRKLLAGKPKSLAQRYSEAIDTRHEVDEVRSHIRMGKDLGKSYFSDDYTHFPYLRGKFHTHAHPDVIARESAHVAIAPKEVRKLNTLLRASEQIPGIEYGKSAVPELKKSRKYSKQLLEEFNKNNPNVLPYPPS